MKVCITEKPSVARDIAAILGATSRRDGFIEGNGYRVTWTYGHLCCLKDPADYCPEWKQWAISRLPMIPERFGIKIIHQEHIEKQFRVIAGLVKDADEVINCGDAGQEGELIQRWVMQKAGVKCPVKRLWISSLTDESIREGFSHLEPDSRYDNLYYAGMSRAIGDWLLGLNATRLYTVKYSPGRGTMLSVGRVQTPTLAMIVERHFAIVNFRPEDFWELHTRYRDAEFTAVQGKFTDRAKAEAALAAVTGQPLRITDVSEKQGKEAPQRLFDLTSLQVECNRRWGWSADESLRLIQSLYEKKVTTYPRVDTTYLPDDLYPKVPEILRRMTPYANLTAPVLADKIRKSKKVFDNSKVTDHHAIIPTGESPVVLVGNERQLYHLIALRFIAAFYPDCTFATTTVLAESAGEAFKATGKVIVEPGWRVLFGKEEASDDKDTAILPSFSVGEQGPHTPVIVTKTTQPPKYYTEGTLLRAMETAGRSVEEEELREAMKENGIGRPSTRAAIIETLFNRKYVRRERKNIVPTQAGIELIATIRQDLIKSPKLTGIWENKLRRIERGTYKASEFIDELKTMVQEVVSQVVSDNSGTRISVPTDAPAPPEKSSAKVRKPAAPRAPRVKTYDQITCPECGRGHIVKGRTAFGCSRYAEGCHMLLTFDKFSADLTPQRLATAIRKLKEK